MDDRERARKYDPKLEDGWRRMWPFAAGFEPTADGSDEQRNQVDRYVLMPDGRRIPVEEKVRLRAFEYDVILELEHKHDDGRVEPGWLLRKCDAEYYGMLWVPSMAFVVLPAMALRGWWDQQVRDKKIGQIETKSTRPGANATYRTKFAIVPLADLPFAQGVNLL